MLCLRDDNLFRIAELAGRIIAHRRLTVKLISWQCLFLPCSPPSPGRAIFHFSLALPPHHSRKHVTNELERNPNAHCFALTIVSPTGYVMSYGSTNAFKRDTSAC